MNLYRVDFPDPVGIATASHTITGSVHLVPVQVTFECVSMKLTTEIRPNNTAVGGTLRACPMAEHPYCYYITSPSS